MELNKIWLSLIRFCHFDQLFISFVLNFTKMYPFLIICYTTDFFAVCIVIFSILYSEMSELAERQVSSSSSPDLIRISRSKELNVFVYSRFAFGSSKTWSAFSLFYLHHEDTVYVMFAAIMDFLRCGGYVFVRWNGWKGCWTTSLKDFLTSEWKK